MTIGQSSYPTTPDTETTLIRPSDWLVVTTLRQPVGPDDVTLPVENTAGFSDDGVIELRRERISYTGKTDREFTGCTRGAFRDDGGGPARRHRGGEDVRQRMTSTHHRVLVDAILAMQAEIDTGGGGGATDLDGLTDVTLTSPADGEVLTFDSGTGAWVNESDGHAHTLDDLSDVTITNPEGDHFLQFNGADWSNQPILRNLDDINDVVLTTPSDGEVLTFDSGTGAWVNEAATGGGGGYTTIQDEGLDLTQQDTINFVGDSVVAFNDAAAMRTRVSINHLATAVHTALQPPQDHDHTASGGEGGVLANPSITSFLNATHNHQDSAGGGQLTTAAIGSFAEAVRDTIGATLVEGANVTITVDDVANTITIAAATSGGATIDVQEEGVSVVAAADTLNFDGDTFDVTDETGGVAGVAAKRIPVPIPIFSGADMQGSNANRTWTNMPSADEELFGSTRYRTRFDLTNATEFRLVGEVSSGANSGAYLRGEYSTNATTWNPLGATASDGQIDADVNQVAAGTWAALVAGAQADVWLRIIGGGSNGNADPIFGNLFIQIK